jgi:integrase
MSTTIEPTTKRARNTSVVLTDRMCEKRVDKRVRIYDRKCPGLFVSIITAGSSTFFFKFTDRAMGKQRCKWLGVYNPETFTVEHARAEVYALRARIGKGENVAESFRRQKATAAKQGVTVDQLIEKRIEAISVLEKKDDGEMRPTVESCENVARHLRNLVSPRLGRMIAREVTPDDIATLSSDIVAGKYVVDGKARKPSLSNARHMRRAASAMFRWAMEAGDHRFVDANPCVNLPRLKRERPKTRVLSEDEIRVLWHGLDRSLPWDRTTRLAIKAALVLMLRSNELLPIHRSELDIKGGVVNIPAKRVKKRRLIRQPLSSLAVEIINESMGNYEYAFSGRFGDAPLSRQAMSGALKGTKKTLGICALLGMKPFTPHDLRRSAATMCERLRLPGADISLCLDHQTNVDENGERTPVVTQEVYSLAFDARIERKRKVLDAWAVELRRIVGEPAAAELPLAA